MEEIHILDDSNPWTMDHEEVIHDVNEISEVINPVRKGVRTTIATRTSIPESGKVTGSSVVPPGDSKAQSSYSGQLHQGVTRVEVTSGRRSDRVKSPEHSFDFLGLLRGGNHTLKPNNTEAVITSGGVGRDPNYNLLSHTNQPNMHFSVQNNCKDPEDRQLIKTLFEQMGFLTEQVNNLKKDNMTFQVDPQQKLNAASSGTSQYQSVPLDLPGGSGQGVSINPHDQYNSIFSSHSKKSRMPGNYFKESQFHSNEEVARDLEDDASVCSEDRNLSR